ncbi:MAG TPA: serine hydrolase domain-containing protein, partial [Candidatus Polarisedimenticolia bacterium]
SKQFTAASIALLEQQGKLSLDDDLRKYVPEIPAYKRPITLRHLLHHTSGLRDYLDLMTLAGLRTEDVSTDDDALRLLARQKETNFPPGDEHLYCNSGFFLLSIVVKRVTGQPLREFARANIFEPLGMRSTRFHDDHTKIEPGRTTGYQPLEGGGFRIDMSNYEQTGDGSVFTNVEDLARWDANFYDPKVGGAPLLKTLQTRGTLNDGSSIDYALGLYLDDYRGLHRVSHGGSWAGYRAELARFPDQHFSVACLCNLGTASPSGLAMKVADLYLTDSFTKPAADAVEATGGPTPTTGPPPVPDSAPPAGAVAGAATTPAPEELSKEAGLYRNRATEEIVTVEARGSRLQVSRDGEMIEFEPAGGGRFRGAGGERELEIAFEAGKTNGARRLIFKARRGAPQIFEATVPLELSAQQLHAYAGSYWSEEMQVSYALSPEGGRLALAVPNLPKLLLIPTARDIFAADALALRFDRDAASRVKGFRLGAGRIRNVGFVHAAR